MHGVTHTELKLSADGPVVIEVNGRLGGAINELYTLTGRYQPVRAALETAGGQPPRDPAPPHSYAAVLWHHMDGRRPTREVFEALRALKHVVRLQVPREDSTDISQGRLVPPVTVVLQADDSKQLASIIAHCQRELADA